MKKPYVGIIIPCYNCEDYIEDSMRSCLEQDYKNILLIVVDDCSTDDSLSIMEKIHLENEHVFSGVNERNSGAARTRNVGAKIAQNFGCDLLLFHDADDIMTKNSIVDRVKLFEDQMVAVAYGDYYNLLEDGSTTYENKPDFDFFRLLEDNYISCLSMTRTETFERVGGFNENLTYGEDWLLWMRICQYGIGVHVHTPCFYYRANPFSLTRKIDWNTYKLDMDIIKSSMSLVMGNGSAEDLMLKQNKKIRYVANK